MAYAVIAKSLHKIIQLHGTAYGMKKFDTLVKFIVFGTESCGVVHASQHLLPIGVGKGSKARHLPYH
jgi:hypothetical protein